MYNTADQLLKRIDTAKVHIRSLFVQQCIHGCQTKTLNDPQFGLFGDSAPNRRFNYRFVGTESEISAEKGKR